MFLDTANLKEINKNFSLGIFKGVTTNPTLLLKEKKERFELIDAILSTGIESLFVQVVGETVEELQEDYKKIRAIHTEKEIIIKVPINVVGLEFIKEIKKNYPEQQILGTAIYSTDQGILASIAGCDYLAPYVNRMSNNDLDPYVAISQMKQFIDKRGLSTKIMAASFKNTKQVIDALMAGAHTATIPTDIADQMINKELAMNAIDVFNRHGKELEGIFPEK